MDRDKETEQSIEELSSLLDELNIGRDAKSDDSETAELLAVAKLIQNSDLKVQPPPHILQQTADRALQGLKKNKKSRIRTWLFSGTVGVAATVVMAAGLNLIPSWSEPIPPIPPQAPVVDYNSGPKEAEQNPTVLSAVPEEGKKAEPPVVLTEVGVSQGVKVDKLAAPPEAARSVSQSAKPGGTKSASKSITTEEKNVQPEAFFSRAYTVNSQLIPLVLPGKDPGQVETDYVNKTIRQVYDKDTPRQLVVTQAMNRTAANAAATGQQKALSLKGAGDKAGQINKVTVIIMEREVTLEGCYSKQELLKLAESLVLEE